MKDNKRITRKEAALVLGICEQSVANLIARGALSTVRQGQMYYLSRDEVEALIPMAKDLREVEKAFREAEAELKELTMRRVGEARVQKARCEFMTAIAGTRENWSRYRDVVLGLYEAVTRSGLLGDDITEREKNVLRDILDFTPLYELSKRYGLTPERVRQIYNRALVRIVRFSKGIAGNYGAMMQEASGWRDYAKGLEDINRRLKAENEQYRPRNEREEEREEFLRRDISQLELSARTVNWLKVQGVDTVGELIKHRRRDVMRFRNIGRRSMAELDRFLERNGIEWNNQ